MTTGAKKSWRQFYDDQIRYCETLDYEGIRSHYTEDAALIAFDYQVFGREAIVEHFKEYLTKMVAGLKILSTDKYVETDDVIFFEASVETNAGYAKVYDAFTMKDGLIHRHLTGLISFSPKS